MRVPLSWLRDFAPFGNDVVSLTDALDDLGLVVEGVERLGEGLEDVVAATVLEIHPIQGADKIRRVLVDTGSGSQEVVCGAWNFEAGDVVPLAKVGARLPGGFEISSRKLKGVVSNGMLCSGKELGLSDDASGIMILSKAPTARESGITPGTPLREALGIEREVVFDIAVDVNRPDALCVSGIARDLAAKLRLPFTLEFPQLDETPPPSSELTTLDLQAPDLCDRIVTKVLMGVSVGPSPQWMARRLTLAGMRPINNVVDVSNYVMLELGQPTHPYDLDLLGGRGLQVRRAYPGEKLRTLDGIERTLGISDVTRIESEPADDCVIADATGRIVGIGGLMGGSDTEISPSTTRVLIEAAHFAPMAIARTAKRLGLRTEASVRFERGCDPEGIDRAVARFCSLLSHISGPELTVAAGTVERRYRPMTPTKLSLRPARVNAILGTSLEPAAMASLLEPIGFQVSGAEGDEQLQVTVPTFRPDCIREIDVIEEIARHLGYQRIERTRPVPRTSIGRLTSYQRERRTVREVLAGLGASEAWTSSFLSPEDHLAVGAKEQAIQVSNPMARDESVLRMSLLPGLLRALRHNASRRQGSIRLFEVGNVFFLTPDGSAFLERERVAALLSEDGDDARTAVEGLLVLLEAVGLEQVSLVADQLPGMHPTRGARIVTSKGERLGVVGEVDPAVLSRFDISTKEKRAGFFEVDLAMLLGAERRSRLAREISRFPSTDIDLAFVVDERVPAAAVKNVLRQEAGELLESIKLFDVYRGIGIRAGSRSLTFRLRFVAKDRTLTDDEVNALRQRLIDKVEVEVGAELRS